MTISTLITNLEEWKIFKDNLIPGCTFEYLSQYPQQKFEKAFINENLTASFLRQDWDQNWDILRIGIMVRHNLYNFCWPDDSPMAGWQTYEKPRELTKEERIIKKCQSLDAKFKAKSLPKCTTKSLSFPDKKIPLLNKKEISNINDDFLQYLTTNIYTQAPRRTTNPRRTISWNELLI